MNDNHSHEREQALVDLVRSKAQRYLRLPGVTSVGVGFRQRPSLDSGQPQTTDELCIQFTVEAKLTPEALARDHITPLPESFQANDGTEIRVQVLERSFQPAYTLVSDPDAQAQAVPPPHKTRRTRQDPIRPGISVSHAAGSAGTIGAIVYDNQTGSPLILSNWHVLDGGTERNIVQPGPSDDVDIKANQVGRLTRSHIGLAGDCAVSSIEGRRFSESILELDVTPTKTAKVNLGDTVVKSGRTTGVTYGIVTRVGVTAKIPYPSGVRQVGAFEIRPNPERLPADGEVSLGGDSGSLWLIDGNETERDIAVGLHFAGESIPDPSAEHALACNIHSVLDKLDVSLTDTESPVMEDEELWNEVLRRIRILELAITYQARSLETRSLPEDGLRVYGNWCGPSHGSGEPIDEVDRACMDHDLCYDDKGYTHCDCDKDLVRRLGRLIESRQLNAKQVAAATAISAWFTAQPCTYPIDIGGIRIPIPIGTGGTLAFVSDGVKSVTRAGKSVWKKIRSIF